jgi:GTP-binding protein LepA
MDVPIGDTITNANEYKSARAKGLDPPIEPLPGYSESKPMVYCGLFPADADEYETLRVALGKLRLNDAALSYEPENSGAMGFGFRCGFLGLLHMEIVQERLSREYDLDLIMTAPSVVYKVKLTNRKEPDLVIDAPAKMPDLARDDVAYEPFVKMEILTPRYVFWLYLCQR